MRSVQTTSVGMSEEVINIQTRQNSVVELSHITAFSWYNVYVSPQIK